MQWYIRKQTPETATFQNMLLKYTLNVSGRPTVIHPDQDAQFSSFFFSSRYNKLEILDKHKQDHNVTLANSLYRVFQIS